MRMIGPQLEPPTLAGPDLTYVMCSALGVDQTGGRPALHFTYGGHYLEFLDSI